MKQKKHKPPLSKSEMEKLDDLVDNLKRDLVVYYKDCDSLIDLCDRLKIFDKAKYSHLKDMTKIIKQLINVLHKDLVNEWIPEGDFVKFRLNDTLYLTDSAIFLKYDRMNTFILNIDIPVKEVYLINSYIKGCMLHLKQNMQVKGIFYRIFVYFPVYLYDSIKIKFSKVLTKQKVKTNL